MSQVKRLRRQGGAATAAVLALAMLASCGADDEPQDEPEGVPTASSSPSPTESASPSPTPTETPTARPLSRFEDQPPVKAARRWAAAVAQDITEGSTNLPRSSRFTTADAATRFPAITAEDMGLRYPGPLPFTPTRVDVSGRSAAVTVCLWAQGWGVDPETGQSEQARTIRPNVLRLVREGRAWKMDRLEAASHSCDGVRVRGVGG